VVVAKRHTMQREGRLSVIASIALLLLACVFGLAGVMKLLDRAGTRRAVQAFGTPPRLVPAGAAVLPLAELAIAASLIPSATARWGALAAVALLAVFCAAIIRALRSGVTPDCNCFGGLSQTEVGRGTLLRNLLLAGVAGLAAVGASDPPIGALNWVTVPAARDRPVLIVLASCLAILGWVCWQLLRQNGRLILALEARPAEPGRGRDALAVDDLAPLEPGMPAPEFTGRDLDGETVSLHSLLAAGRPVLLFFTDPACVACAPGLELVARAQRERADELTLAVISRGSLERTQARSMQLGLQRVVPQRDEALFEAYRVFGVPGVVLIDADGRLEHPIALGVNAAREIIDNAGTDRSPGVEAAIA
jgi:peroxiredoxin/uncharacterized membrane protein YphA (DoxX/SURF4 family)